MNRLLSLALMLLGVAVVWYTPLHELAHSLAASLLGYSSFVLCDATYVFVPSLAAGGWVLCGISEGETVLVASAPYLVASALFGSVALLSRGGWVRLAAVALMCLMVFCAAYEGAGVSVAPVLGI